MEGTGKDPNNCLRASGADANANIVNNNDDNKHWVWMDARLLALLDMLGLIRMPPPPPPPPNNGGASVLLSSLPAGLSPSAFVHAALSNGRGGDAH